MADAKQTCKPVSRSGFVLFLLVVLVVGLAWNCQSVHAAVDYGLGKTSWPLVLSDIWSWRVKRWEEAIVSTAIDRGLDPDFVASLVWMESRGDPRAVGPVGAVGLMQIMPREAGYSWRPSRETLMDPATNLMWGTRTLAIVVRQSHGDIFNALAAYNGGWAQVMYRGPKIFATTILRDYASAVAARYGSPLRWMVLFAVVDPGGIRGPIWVADWDRDDVYLYGDFNWVPDGSYLIPDVRPAAILAMSHAEDTGEPFLIGAWLFDQATHRWLEGSVEPSMALALEEGSASQPDTHRQISVDDHPASLPPVAALGRMSTPTPTPVAVSRCAGGKLELVAWPVEVKNTPDGWMARIYAEARGGMCRYTYAWNDLTDVKAQDVNGAILFDVSSTRRDSPILGTVVVASGVEEVRVGLYIRPPGG